MLSSGGDQRKMVCHSAFCLSSRPSRGRSKSHPTQWKKNSYADGYQLEYSTNKKFSGSSTSVLEMESADTLNAKVTGLEKGKKYFFRIRTIKVIYDPVEGSESRIFGKWSKIKKIKAR